MDGLRLSLNPNFAQIIKKVNRIIMNVLLRIVLVTWFSGVLLMPGISHALNLKLSVITALSRAEETKIASSQVRQSKLNVSRKQASNNSRLSIGAKLGPQYQISDVSDDDSYVYLQSNASITKPFLDGENRRFSIEASELQLLAVQYQSRSVLEQTAMDVIRAYISVVYQQEIVRIHSNNIAEFRNVEEITVARKNNGIATDADVLLVKARVIGAGSALNRARLELAQSQNEYNVLVGPIENDMIIPFSVDNIFFQNFELMTEKMRSQNSSLQQSKYRRRVALADLNVLRSKDSAIVDGSIEYDYANTFGGGIGQSITFGAYVNFSYNYSFGDVLDLEINQQQERIKELSILRELLIRDLEIELQKEYSNYQSLKKVVRAIEKELYANKGVLAAQKEQQKIGKIKLVDILNSQDRVNNARIRLLQSEQEDQLSRYKLLALSGELLSFFRE
jgi:outer membrane protein TolC